jgi:hypothetical protein
LRSGRAETLREDDLPPAVDEQHRHRRVLHHRVEQQLALHEVEPLLAQHRAQRVVRFHEVADLVVASQCSRRSSRRRGS